MLRYERFLPLMQLFFRTEGEKRIIMKMFNTTKAPSFPEFIGYLLRTPPNLMETYWAPYTKV